MTAAALGRARSVVPVPAALRVGIVGFGVMGRRHFDVLTRLIDVHVVGVADHGRVDGWGGADLVHVPTAEELLALNPDALIIATPPASHRALVELCVHRGVHALVEKPLAACADDSRAIVALSEATPAVVVVGHVERFSSALLGRWPGMPCGPGWVIQTHRTATAPRRRSEIGVLLDLAVHDVDLVRALTRCEYQAWESTVNAVGGNGHDTDATILATLANGTQVCHRVRWGDGRPTRGLAFNIAGDITQVDLANCPPTALATQARAFVEACRGSGLGRLATAADGAAAVAVVLGGRHRQSGGSLSHPR